MTIKISHSFVLADDKEAALGFYRDTVGLVVVNDVQFETMRWLSLASPDRPDQEIVIESPADNRNINDDDVQSVFRLLAKGMFTAMIFTVDDVDATFEKVQASGAEVIQEPIDQPYGVRDCAFRDPAGNHVRFSQVSSS
ncbi:MAG: VOC family protein [Mycobacteriales bacterium]